MMTRFLICMMVAAFATSSMFGQDDFSAELPRIPPTPASEAGKTFQVANGFRMELVAAEPLVSTPVAIEWDADGSLFVCEMRGYSEEREEAISRITRLTDQDQDGIFDHRTIYAEGLLWPTGLLPYDGGLFVGDAPDLIYLKDTDQDGVADEKRVVLTGFGTSNVQGLMNSFRWDLDNRLHIACSSVGGMVRHPEQPESSAVNVRGRDLALDPRTEQFELTSGAAQHGMCFDDWGRKFVSSNSNHLQQVMYEDRYIARNPFLKAPPSRISIASDGPQAEVFRTSPVEPWRIVRTRLRVGGLVPGPVEGGGRAAGYFTGATGATIYRGDAWPDKYRGYAIIGDVGSNLVHRKELVPNGLQWTGNRVDEQTEFVTSTDIWFRPAQFANAPDGTLHVIDVCREVIEHPKSLPPDIKKHLDLNSGRDRGRIYRIAPDGFAYRPTPDLAQAPVQQLVRLLAHPNAWHRETAARRLFELADAESILPLRRLLAESKSPLGRMHALYVLQGQNALDTATVIERLSDPHPGVRAAAVRLSERVPSSEALREKLATVSQDDSIHVRYQLAFTVGSVEDLDAAPVLAAIVKQDPSDRWIQAAVQSSAAEAAGSLFAQLVSDAAFRASGGVSLLGQLAGQIAQQNDENSLRQALSAIEQLPISEGSTALPIIGRLLSGQSRSSSVIHQLTAAGELAASQAVLKQMVGTLMVKATNASLPQQARVSAIDDLAYGDIKQVGATLASLIDNRQPQAVQRAAIKTLGEFRGADVVKPLLDQWSGLSPALRETASEVLFARTERLSAWLDAVDRGDLTVTDLSRPRLVIAAKSKNPEIRGRATAYLNATGSKQRSEVITKYRSALNLDADVQQGRVLFQKHCSNCHRVEGVGHEIGPNLMTIKTRGAETILVNVLDPNREVNPEYLNYTVLTEDGRTMSGMIAAESATSLTLKRAESATDQVLRREIDVLQSTGMSIMPEGMEELIDVQGMADLIAYLMEIGSKSESRN
ncbi:MAG: HEAT repeat domain-containing protein [Rubripirellula sp.]|nr:HEAT repeat domain-containing protein [Rubripirellula sp.]